MKKNTRELFAERLKILRKARRVSQQQAAKKIGISSATLSDYETCRSTPSIEILTLLADYYAVSADYLLGRSEINRLANSLSIDWSNKITKPTPEQKCISDEFALRLRKLRFERGVSLKRVSEETGISQSALDKYEHGSVMPRIDSLIAVTKYYNVSADYLLGVVDNDGALKFSRAAVAKQVQKIPWLSYEGDWCCPNCNITLGYYKGLASDYETPYCSQCGQKLNWKDKLLKSTWREKS